MFWHVYKVISAHRLATSVYFIFGIGKLNVCLCTCTIAIVTAKFKLYIESVEMLSWAIRIPSFKNEFSFCVITRTNE